MQIKEGIFGVIGGSNPSDEAVLGSDRYPILLCPSDREVVLARSLWAHPSVSGVLPVVASERKA
jgi:hypothetical protein